MTQDDLGLLQIVTRVAFALGLTLCVVLCAYFALLIFMRAS